MKYIKYGFYSVTRNPFFNILIMIEIAVILVVCNLTVAAANSKFVLMAPYDDFANSDGYIYTPLENKKISVFYDPELIRDNFYKSLKGDVTVRYSYYVSAVSVKSVLNDAFGFNDRVVYEMYAFDEEFFSKMNVPLLDGRWASTKRNEKGQIEAVVVLDKSSKVSVGDVIHTKIERVVDGNITQDDIGDVVVVGTINYDSYYPDIRMKTGSIKDVTDLYTSNYGGDESSGGNIQIFLVSAAAEELFQNKQNIGLSSAFITYNSPPTDEEREYNYSLLDSSGDAITSGNFKRHSYEYLLEEYKKFLPILLGVFVIVIAELICSVAMNTKKQMRNYGIYFLCGCRWKGCLKISLAYSAIILVGGSLLGAGLFAAFNITEYSKMFEQNFQMNNICVTLVIFAVMLVVSLIIPCYMVNKISPVETIKEN